MSSLSEIYIKVETLETMLNTVRKKGAKGLSVTIGLNDTADKYNQNVSAFVSQTKDDREAKKPKYYIGNGRTFYSKGETPVFRAEKKEEEPTTSVEQTDDLPF